MRLPSIETHDGRRAFAFLAILGGCIVFTVFAAVGVWLVSGHANYSFWLALAAHAQIFLGLGGMCWFAGRRMLARFSRDGVTIDDRGHAPPAPECHDHAETIEPIEEEIR